MTEVQNLDFMIKVKSDSEFHDWVKILALGCVLPKKMHTYQFLNEIVKMQNTTEIGITYYSIQESIYQIYGKIPLPRIFQCESTNPEIILSKSTWEDMLSSLWVKGTFATEELEVEFPWISPLQIKILFEKRLQPNQKRFVQKGAFYSPQAEIQFLIRRAFKKYERLNEDLIYSLQREKFLRILDPACGCGDFLVEIVSYFSKFPSKNMPELVLYGMDINEWAVIITEFRIWAKYLFILYGNPNDAKQLRNNSHQQSEFNIRFLEKIQIKQGDFLFEAEQLGISPKKTQIFDVIVGNPPYIRYRDITHPYHHEPKENQGYREKLVQSMKKIPGIPTDFDIQCDYYIYFYLVGLQYLKTSGILGFIVSNSWMNVGFGGPFQDYLLKNARIFEIHDNLQRSFAAAEINTVITILGVNRGNEMNENPLYFVKWKWYFQEINDSDTPQLEEFFENGLKSRIKDQKVVKIAAMNIDICENQYARIVQLPETTILSISKLLYPDTKTYQGFNWANYFLLAPPFFFQILSQLGQKFIMLRDIAEIRRGITTNCNDFFVLSKKDKDLYENGYGDSVALDSDVLIPFLESPRQLSHPMFHPTEVDTVLFFTDKSTQELERNNCHKSIQYVHYGENKKIQVKKGTARGQSLIGIHQLASFRERYTKDSTRWYCLKRMNARSSIETFNLFIEKIFDTTIKIGYSDTPIIVNNTFYEIYLKPEYKGQERFIFALLFGSLTYLCMELHGRTNFGGGALDTATFDIEKIIIPNPVLFDTDAKQKILENMKGLSERSFLPASQEIEKAERQDFDRIIKELGHLSLDYALLYASITQIQKYRVKKSNSFNTSNDEEDS